jgi:aminopeptidase YwaD
MKRLAFVLAFSMAATPTRAALAPDAGARIQADVARLAGDAWEGRRAGTAGADAAAEWIAAEFAAAGLTPAAGGSFLQPFTFIDGVDLGPANRLAIAGGTPWKAGTDFQPLAFSAAGQVTGAVAFAGYGIVARDLAHDDYEGLDVKDKIVLVLRYGPDGDDPQSKWAAFTSLRMKASNARDRGARALLAVSGPRTRDAGDDLVPLQTDASLADAGLPAFSIKRAVADALLRTAETTLDGAQQRIESGHAAAFLIPRLTLEAQADVTPRRATTRNVVGLVRGTTSDAVVVGAHYDHLGLGMRGSLEPAATGKIHHGADDNASGTAALLALARAFAPRRATLQRSIVFVAFGAEEEGTLGSSHFIKDPPLPLDSIVAMLNMDMIGRLREGALDVHGVGTSPIWRPLVEEANRSAGLSLKIREGGYGPSDHNVFYAAGKPVLFVFTGPHADYHRPSDTADKISAEGIVKILGLLEPVVASLASSTAPVAFTRVAADKEQSGPSRGFRVWVGGIPDYSAEGAGVKLSGVTPGSPAEKAGMRAGDVLVRFGPKEIRNIYDYTYALGAHKPGEVVTLVVQREGKDVSLDVTLGSRPSATQ